MMGGSAWKIVLIIFAYPIFAWFFVRDIRAHEPAGAVVGLIIAAIFTRFAYMSLRPKRN
jgi:hypothetical protein